MKKDKRDSTEKNVDGRDENLLEKASLEICSEALKNKVKDQEKLNSIKKRVAKKYSLQNSPTNIQILNHLPQKKKERYQLFTTKPIRTSSGVAVVAVMSYPFECPHGRCHICPGGPGSEFGDVPQSYTGKEPATRRAIRNDYDPYLQVMNRLEQYVVINQVPEKIELIIMGGTFPSFKKRYQNDFVKCCLKAMNDFSREFFRKGTILRKKFNRFFELPGNVSDPGREKSIKKKLLKLKKKNKKELEKEQKLNEDAVARCVGMTIETRPDYAFLDIGRFLLELGCTRVELGIQSVYEKDLEKINRGHTVQDSVKAVRILKNLGFKLNFHYMIGLPGWTEKKDKEGLRTLFKDERFRPDMLKIYPCMVLKGTRLYEDWNNKKYQPLTTKKAVKIIYDFLPETPEYCRIMRVQRDIPTQMTVAGVDRTNLRQYVEELNPETRDIRAREPSARLKNQKVVPKKISLVVREYDASEGKEFFISAEDTDNDILVGFCRLRFPSAYLKEEISPDCALIRELHVYGAQASLGEKDKSKMQHRGIGKKLLKKAEVITKKDGRDKILIISGIGVRNYYRRQGYRRQGPYMSKRLF